MQKRPFLAAIRSYERQWLLFAFGLVACFWALIVLVVPAMVRHFPDTTSRSARLAIFYTASALLLVGFALLRTRLLPRLPRKFSLVCPSCTKPFSAGALAELGYTETCSARGSRVFDPEAPYRRIDKSQFLTPIHDYRHDIGQLGKKVAVIAIAPSVIGLGIMFLRPAELRDFGRIFLGVIAVGGLFAALAYSISAKRRVGLRFGLVCPSCRKPFSSQELRDLGYSETCAKCGEHVFD